jgi:hypothetical protein
MFDIFKINTKKQTNVVFTSCTINIIPPYYLPIYTHVDAYTLHLYKYQHKHPDKQRICIT